MIPRTILLAPLKVIKDQCKSSISNPDRKAVYDFINRRMHPGLYQPVLKDAVVRKLDYAVNIPMTDNDWLSYNKIMVGFPFAMNLQLLLAKGPASFDYINNVRNWP